VAVRRRRRRYRRRVQSGLGARAATSPHAGGVHLPGGKAEQDVERRLAAGPVGRVLDGDGDVDLPVEVGQSDVAGGEVPRAGLARAEDEQPGGLKVAPGPNEKLAGPAGP